LEGAGGGIGRAAAVRFAQEGATVIVTDRKFEHAQATAKKLGGKFTRYYYYYCRFRFYRDIFYIFFRVNLLKKFI
jgi:NAD(P)-dependent dehydrogenase (short-subunit alcohol dehydrogenase family)